MKRKAAILLSMLFSSAIVFFSCQKQNQEYRIAAPKSKINQGSNAQVASRGDSGSVNQGISPNLAIPACSPENITVIDWYLETFDENGNIISEVYMFTTNYCSEAGGGNSGGNSNTPEELAGSILDIMDNNTNAASTKISASAVEVTPTTRTSMYKWKCVQGKGWWLSSIERGVQKKIVKGAVTNWEWQSLDHVNITKDGFVVGGEISYNLLYTNPIIGKYNAAMNLGIELAMTTKVVGTSFARYKTLNASSSFNVYDQPWVAVE